MDEIVVDFKTESKDLIDQLLALLEAAENHSHMEKLQEYAQIVDRIMGGASSLAMTYEDSDQVRMISRYAELCKLVGYKASKIENESFYQIVLAFLMDATEMLDEIVERFGTAKEVDIAGQVSEALVGRLTWISERFDQIGKSAEEQTIDRTSSRDEIRKLLHHLGIKAA